MAAIPKTGKLSPENMTHAEPPWQNTPPDEIITKEKIHDYFCGCGDIYGKDAIRLAGIRLGFDDLLIIDHVEAAQQEGYDLFKYAQIMENSWRKMNES